MQSRMRTKLSLALGGFATGALIVCLGASCQQPPTLCTTAHLYYAASFELKSGDASSACGGFKGDILGMQTYFETGGTNGTPKFNKPSAAVRTQYSSLILDYALNYADQEGNPVVVPGFEDPEDDLNERYHLANALAKFDRGEPTDDDLCTVKELTATIDIPELPALPEIPPVPFDPPVADDPATPDVDESIEVPGYPAVPATPPISMKYEWTDATWLVNPNMQGTAFEADLKFTQDGCTAEYHVVAIAPAVGCQSDDDCEAEGVGINPDFAVKCDLSFEDQLNNVDTPAVEDDPATPDVDETAPAQNWGVCVASKKFPSLK